MRYYIDLLMIVVLSLVLHVGYSQSMEILFEGSSVTLVSSRTIPDINLNQAKDEPQPLYKLFYQYYFPASLQEYKSLFYNGNFPSGIEDHYDLWRKNMQGVNIQLTGILNGLYKGHTTSILNFSFIKDGYTIRMSFFAKLIDGKWYPYESTELMNMHELNNFFPVLNPAVVQSMLSHEADNFYKSIANDVLQECGAGRKQVSVHCLYALAEGWGIASDAHLQQKAEKLFLTRVRNAQRAPGKLDPENIRIALQPYGIDDKEIRVITYYLNRGETMLAYARIQFHVPGLQFEEVNEKMKPVLGEQALQIHNTKTN